MAKGEVTSFFPGGTPACINPELQSLFDFRLCAFPAKYTILSSFHLIPVPLPIDILFFLLTMFKGLQSLASDKTTSTIE